MNQTDYNLWSVVLGGVSAVISLGVGGIVAWYTSETHKLRKATERQVGLLTDQTRALVAPFLLLTHVNYRPRVEVAHTNITAEKERYECDIYNQTDRLAYHVSVVVRNRTALFLGYAESVEPYAGKEGTYPATVVVPRNDDAIAEVKKAYGDTCAESLEEVSGDFTAIVFRDMRGNVGLLKRAAYFMEISPTLLHRSGPPVPKWF